MTYTTGRAMTAAITKAEYTAKMERFLEDMGTRFQKLELEQMKKGEVEARARLAEAQKRFAEKKNDLETRLSKLRKAGDDSWSELKTGIDSAWNELESAFDRARTSFAEELETVGTSRG